MVEHYLSGRQTRCQINGHVSSLQKLTSGVGEGSVLGPTLYTLGQICVSEVCSEVKQNMWTMHQMNVNTMSCEYADDVTGCLSADTDEDLQIAVNDMMEGYTKYFSSCGLCLNQKKCSVLVIRSKARTATIYLGDKKEEDKIKLLGLWVDNRYDFDFHLNYVVRSCTYKISCLRKIRPWLSTKYLKEMTESLVLGQIFYGSEIYMRLQKIRTKAQKLVNTAARLVLDRDRFENCETMMRELEWLNMDNHLRYQQVASLRRLLRTQYAHFTFSMLDWSTKLSQSINN